MLRRTLAGLALAALVTPGLGRSAEAQDWKATIKQFRIGILGGENTQDRLKSYDGFQKLLEAKLGVPVKLFPSADYAGVMQGIASGQLEAAEFGASGFAGTWLDCKCVEPVIVPQEKDGSTYYYSVMVTRKDSGITSIEQMRGHSLAWADPNSTSGYNMPLYTLDKMGIEDASKYFNKVLITGSHENAVIAVADKTVDVCANWWNADDDSNLTRMLNKGMLKNPDGTPMKKDDFRIVLKSSLIINSPTAMLADLPPDLKTAIRSAFLNAATADKAAFDRLSDGKNLPWQPTDNAAYDDTIKMVAFVDRLRRKQT